MFCREKGDRLEVGPNKIATGNNGQLATDWQKKHADCLAERRATIDKVTLHAAHITARYQICIR